MREFVFFRNKPPPRPPEVPEPPAVGAVQGEAVDVPAAPPSLLE